MARCEAYQNLKNFHIPCKIPLSRLKEQFSGVLTINETRPCTDEELQQYQQDSDSNHSEPADSPAVEEEQGQEQEQEQEEAKAEEPQFKAPLPKEDQPPVPAASRSRTTKSLKRRGSAAQPPVKEPPRANLRTNNSSNNNNNDAPAKPGVVAANNSTNHHQQGANKRYKNGKQSKPELVMIDTGGFVDETIVSFLPELCQKADISDVPDDPMELCEKFQLIIADCRIAEFDDHYREFLPGQD